MKSPIPTPPAATLEDTGPAAALGQWSGDDRFMQSLARGLLALGEVAKGKGRPVSVQEIASATGLSAATVRRCLYTLHATGHVRADRNGALPGAALAALTTNYAASSPLISASGPILDALHAALDVTVSVSTYAGDEPVIIASCSTDSLLRVDVQVGSVLPVHCSATGKLYLASLPQAALERRLARVAFKRFTPKTTMTAEALRLGLEDIRKLGVAVVDQELAMGLRSASVAVRNGRGDVIGSVNATTFVQVTTKRELQSHIIPAIRDAALALSRHVP